MKPTTKLRLAPLALVLLLLGSQVACDPKYATALQLIFAAAGPFIESLPVGSDREATIIDFTDLGSATTTLAIALNNAPSKTAKVNAIDTYEKSVEAIFNRGHFTNSETLQRIERLARGIIASARIYYGGTAPPVTGDASARRAPGPAMTKAEAKKDLDAKIKELQSIIAPK